MLKRFAPILLLALASLIASAQADASTKGSATRSHHTASTPKATHVATPRTSTRKSKEACTTCPRNRRGKIARSESATNAFKRQTGFPKGRKGYVIDHVIPLACGGKDEPSNMQWQTAAAAKAKDKLERRGCRA